MGREENGTVCALPEDAGGWNDFPGPAQRSEYGTAAGRECAGWIGPGRTGADKGLKKAGGNIPSGLIMVGTG